MLLARYFRHIYLQACVTVGVATAVLVFCIGVMAELRQSSSLYSFLDTLFFIVQTLPANFCRFYPAAMALAVIVWVWRLRERQELVMAHALGWSRWRVVLGLTPAILLAVLACTVTMEWLAPNLARHAKQVQTQKLSGGQLANTQRTMWFKTAEGFLQARVTDDPQVLENVKFYQLDGQGLHQWGHADTVTWQKKRWVAATMTTTQVEGDKQVSTHSKGAYLPLRIKPSLLAKTAFRTDYLSLTQMWHGLTAAKDHGVLTRLSWVNFWLRILNPLHAWLLVAMVLVWLQSSLDLRSTSFIMWVLAAVVAIILDFSVVENLEHKNTVTDIWGGLWIAALPLVALTLGTIGGLYVRD